jgi:signal transduction histidine kinase
MKIIKIEHFLLTLAGVTTWALVTLVEVNAVKGKPYWHWMAAGYVLFLLFFLPMASGYLQQNRQWLGKALLMLQLLIITALLFAHSWVVTPVLLVIWAGCLPDFFSRRNAILLVILSAVVFCCSLRLAWQGKASLIMALSYFGFQFFALSSSFARVSERSARENVEQLNQKLQATRILLAQSSRQEERVRIARDLHDVLGHQLTALNLQLEILQHKAPDELRESVQQSKSLAKALLENIRQVVRDQRSLLSLDIRQAIQGLAANIPQLDLDIGGELHLDSVQLAEQLVLCIQEGMSNSLRHGRANHIKLVLEQQLNLVKIVLDDNGSGLTGRKDEGTGLRGMRERLAAYGGQVELRAMPDGCRLVISLNVMRAEFAHD